MADSTRLETGLNNRDAAINPKINFVQTFKSEGQFGFIGLVFGLNFELTVGDETPWDRRWISNRQIRVAAIRAITTCINNLRPDT